MQQVRADKLVGIGPAAGGTGGSLPKDAAKVACPALRPNAVSAAAHMGIDWAPDTAAPVNG